MIKFIDIPTICKEIEEKKTKKKQNKKTRSHLGSKITHFVCLPCQVGKDLICPK